MRKRNLRLPDAAAGKSAIASSHNDEVSMPSSSTNPTTGVAGIQTAPARRASEKAKATRIRKKVQQLGRNLSSPARLIKLNALLSDDQKKLVIQWTWGGMLQVKGKSMPVDLSMWLLGCFDPVRSELVIPGRGTIVVDAESYHRNFGLLNEGDPVPFELDPEAIAFMNEEYAIPNGMAPTFAAWCKMIKEMNGVADMKFLRAYIGGVISCFVCPTTKHSITPRCYGAISNLEKARASNFCQLAIDQIRKEVKNMGAKKNSVCCCLYHFVVLYLDSLEVDEPVEPESVCPVRAAAWTDQLIQAVMQKDRKPDGTFGKLRFKEGAGVTIRDSLFVDMAQTELFVSSKLPATFCTTFIFQIYVSSVYWVRGFLNCLPHGWLCVKRWLNLILKVISGHV